MQGKRLSERLAKRLRDLGSDERRRHKGSVVDVENRGDSGCAPVFEADGSSLMEGRDPSGQVRQQQWRQSTFLRHCVEQMILAEPPHFDDGIDEQPSPSNARRPSASRVIVRTPSRGSAPFAG